MKRLLVLSMLAAWGAACLADQPATAPNMGPTVRYFLQWAQEEANTMQGAEERETALMTLTWYLAEEGNGQAARGIASSLTGEARDRAWGGMATMLAWQGDANGALEACSQVSDGNSRWKSPKNVAVILSDRDLATGLKILADVEEPERSYAHSRIVRRRVLSGDVETAWKVLLMISDANIRLEEAHPWVDVGREIKDAEANATSRPQPQSDLARRDSILSSVLESRAQAGKIRTAESFLGQLREAQHRMGVLTAIARYQLHRGTRQQYDGTIRRALKEADALARTDANDFAQMLGWAGRCGELAILLAEAGDTDGAVRLIRKAQAAGQAADKSGIPMFEWFVGTKGIVYLLARAYKPEEALREATGPGGEIDPEFLPALVAGFAEAGDQAKAAELYQKIKTPGQRFQVAISAAEAAMKKMKETAKP